MAYQDGSSGRIMSQAVSLHSIDIIYGGAGGYHAVAGANLTVQAGEFVSIVGPTGCGKSTLLNVAAGLLEPAHGKVEIFGRALQGVNDQAGYLFQQDAMMPWKTARDNIAIGLEVRGETPLKAQAQADEWLLHVGLKGFGDRYPHQLSGGQRKRVGLAQMLIRNPPILLMDEPFGPLDAQTRQMMGNLLLDLWSRERKAVLFVTHDLEEAIALSDRVIIMSSGPAATIIGDYRIELTRPRDAMDVRLDPAFHAVHKNIWEQLRREVLKTYQGGAV